MNSWQYVVGCRRLEALEGLKASSRPRLPVSKSQTQKFVGWILLFSGVSGWSWTSTGSMMCYTRRQPLVWSPSRHSALHGYATKLSNGTQVSFTEQLIPNLLISVCLNTGVMSVKLSGSSASHHCICQALGSHSKCWGKLVLNEAVNEVLTSWNQRNELRKAILDVTKTALILL